MDYFGLIVDRTAIISSVSKFENLPGLRIYTEKSVSFEGMEIGVPKKYKNIKFKGISKETSVYVVDFD